MGMDFWLMGTEEDVISSVDWLEMLWGSWRKMTKNGNLEMILGSSAIGEQQVQKKFKKI